MRRRRSSIRIAGEMHREDAVPVARRPELMRSVIDQSRRRVGEGLRAALRRLGRRARRSARAPRRRGRRRRARSRDAAVVVRRRRAAGTPARRRRRSSRPCRRRRSAQQQRVGFSAEHVLRRATPAGADVVRREPGADATSSQPRRTRYPRTRVVDDLDVRRERRRRSDRDRSAASRPRPHARRRRRPSARGALG